MEQKRKLRWVAIAVEDHRLLAEIVKNEGGRFGGIVGRLIRAAHEERFSKKRKGKSCQN